jgi:hypothetical protein
MGSEDLLAMMHDSLSEATHEAAAIVPFVVGDVFSSALTLATYLKDLVEAGHGWNDIEKFFVQVRGQPSCFDLEVEGSSKGMVEG